MSWRELAMAAGAACALGSAAAWADPSPRISAWQRPQLNETFMRSLTRQQCMTKTLATLASCSSAECTRDLGGILGDCVVWARGDLKSFCATYDVEYLDSYCATHELEAAGCGLLKAAKTALCKSPGKPLK